MSTLSDFWYREEKIGKLIKSTKIKYTWDFYIDGIFHRIEMLDSRLSSKKEILVDGESIFKCEFVDNFTKYFDIKGHEFVIILHGKKYELRIDGKAFNFLINAENNKIFYKEED